MPENDVHKVLLCGDVRGRVKALLSRVNKVLKMAGAFDVSRPEQLINWHIVIQMMFCLGDFFGPETKELEECISGDLKFPIPTYIVAPLTGTAETFVTNNEGFQLCDNLTYLGNLNIMTELLAGSKGTYTTMNGLRVVYMTSVDSDNEKADIPSSILSEAVAAEDYGFLGVDLFLTCHWPKGVENRSTVSIPEESQKCLETACKSISKLAYLIRPRYHFASGDGSYFERPPYRNHKVIQEKACHITRFIALADVKNPQNRKYLYALKLVPIDKMDRTELVSQPPDVTENPYREFVEFETSQDKETEVQTEQYFYNLKKTSNDFERKRSAKKRPATKQIDTSEDGDATARKYNRQALQEKLDRPREQAACWFCLGNPEVKKHLIVSVGTQAYLALPRGPLVSDHLLILTVGHHQSWITCPDYVRQEIEEYKTRLKKMFASQGKVMVLFERNLKTQHYQLQVVPLPFAVAGEVKQAFLEHSKSFAKSPCTLKPIPRNTDLSEICHPGIPYFFVELPTGERLFGRIPKDRISTADLQFGRFVLTDHRILNCPERSDWRECTDDEETETELTEKMRALFSPYDMD